MSTPFTIHPIQPHDRPWTQAILRELWHADEIVSRGRVYSPAQMPGFIARKDGEPAGLATYWIETGQCEILTIDSLVPGIGIGSALIEAIRHQAVNAGCRRLWLITTNDNLAALRFYQKRGFRLAALHRDAIEVSRALKPQIPLSGLDGIPIRDELELEMMLS